MKQNIFSVKKTYVYTIDSWADVIQDASGALFGGIVGGISATNSDSNFWTGKYKILEQKDKGIYFIILMSFQNSIFQPLKFN